MRTSIISIAALLCILLTANNSQAQKGKITTIAGAPSPTVLMPPYGDGGPATGSSVYINHPKDVGIDAAGNKYIVEGWWNCIRKVNPAGIISTIAGSPIRVAGFSGDGGPAAAALLSGPVGLFVDGPGNIYFADVTNQRIRKINTSGIISTVAGNGTLGYTGNGGPATLAAITATCVTVDAAGNIFIGGSGVVRKINTSGIISTVAGTGTLGFSGDGGPATSAKIDDITGIKTDAANNIYLCDPNNNRIRKVNSAGIITTLIGGVGGYSGDGGPATAALIYQPYAVDINAFGDIFFSEMFNHTVRRIDPAGIITTVAGKQAGLPFFSGDNGPATAGTFAIPTGIGFDAMHNLYIATDADNRVRKVDLALKYAPNDSFYTDFRSDCEGGYFLIGTKSYIAGSTIKTSFGDGTSLVSPVLSSTYSTGGYASFTHTYSENGIYTIKHVFIVGTTAVDSFSYSYSHKQCNNILVDFYLDKNSNCIYDPSVDHHIYPGITAVIDLNGTPTDTIRTPGGFYYTAYGIPGDIYTIRVVSVPPGLVLACPSGVVYDTVKPVTNAISKHKIGFNCSSSSSFDLSIYAASLAGTNRSRTDMLVDNPFCTPQNGVLTVDMSPKYTYHSSTKPYTTISGSQLTWNLPGISSLASGKPVLVTLFGQLPSGGPAYTSGDTANSKYVIDPAAGDLAIANNKITRTDSIQSKFDLNYMQVTPSGCVAADTAELEFAVRFENDGTDTVQNIYISDTLSGALDISTLRVVAASANVNLLKIKTHGLNIVEFDFPGIMLPDSIHRNYCQGMIVYKIRTKTGVAAGTTIINRAGVYFDQSLVAMTNDTRNIADCSPLLNIAQVTTGGSYIFPNPATNELVIISDKGAYSSFSITNQLGQVMMQGTISGTQTTTDIRSLAPAMYYITLKGDQGTKVEKFIKM